MTGLIGEFTGANAAKRAAQQAQKAQQAETARQAGITTAANDVNDRFTKQFTSDFYGKQKQNYVDWAQPQLDQQFTDAQKQLTFQLDRSGQLDSSARSEQLAKLQGNYDANAQRIAQAGQQSADTIRNNVEGARSSLISSLAASGDTAGAVNSANAQAAALSVTPSYSPLGQLFGDTTSALAQQAALDKYHDLALDGKSSPYSLGLNSFLNSVQVSR